MKKIVMFLVVSWMLVSCGASSGDTVTNSQPMVDREPNSEHLAKLSEGVDSWNQWRKDNRDIRPDLKFADLSQKDLSNYDLRRTILTRADLQNSNLSGANLTNTILRATNLSGANLTGTIFTGARYDEKTKWPAGFDPVAAGAVLVTK